MDMLVLCLFATLKVTDVANELKYKVFSLFQYCDSLLCFSQYYLNLQAYYKQNAKATLTTDICHWLMSDSYHVRVVPIHSMCLVFLCFLSSILCFLFYFEILSSSSLVNFLFYDCLLVSHIPHQLMYLVCISHSV